MRGVHGAIRTVLPSPRGACFPGRLVVEGRAERASLRINVPSAVVRGMALIHWAPEGWYEITCGPISFFAVLRQATNGQVAFPFPKWCRGELRAGDVVEVCLRRCVRHTVPALREDGLDWFAFVAPEDLPVSREGTLEIWTRYEPPFRIKRVLPWSAFWLLGFYQAEGSKSASAMDWSLANKSPGLLRRVLADLDTWGVEAARCSLEALYGAGQTAEDAERIYKTVGAEIVAVRRRPGVGYEAGVLHARSSMPFLRATRAVLDALVNGDLLDQIPVEAARAFALGFLDGDGTITLDRTAICLRMAGAEQEIRAATQALARGFDIHRSYAKFTDPSSGVRWTIQASEAARLAEAGAFQHTSSRARLVLGVIRQTRSLCALHAAFGTRSFERAEALPIATHLNWLLLHGYGIALADDRIQLTAKTAQLVEAIGRLTAESAAMARVPDEGRTGRKGVIQDF